MPATSSPSAGVHGKSFCAILEALRRTAMRAVKLAAQVTRDHTLHLELPEDVYEGPAEVIVLVPDADGTLAPRPGTGTLADFFAQSRVDSRFLRSKEEIDEALRAERDSWE
jgi:hypothetical protein